MGITVNGAAWEVEESGGTLVVDADVANIQGQNSVCHSQYGHLRNCRCCILLSARSYDTVHLNSFWWKLTVALDLSLRFSTRPQRGELVFQ